MFAQQKFSIFSVLLLVLVGLLHQLFELALESSAKNDGSGGRPVVVRSTLTTSNRGCAKIKPKT